MVNSPLDRRRFAPRIGDGLVNGDGWPARIICLDRHQSEFPIIALIRGPHGGEVIEQYNAEGISKSGDYLREPPIVTKRYGCIYKLGETTRFYNQLAEAQVMADRRALLAFMEITFEDGLPVSTRLIPSD